MISLMCECLSATLLTQYFSLLFPHFGSHFLFFFFWFVVFPLWWKENLWPEAMNCVSLCASWCQLLLLLTGRHPNLFFSGSVDSRGDELKKTKKQNLIESVTQGWNSLKTRADLYLLDMSGSLILKCPFIADLQQKSLLPHSWIIIF